MSSHEIRHAREINERLDFEAETAMQREVFLSKRLQDVEARSDRLELACEALLELVVSKGLVSAEELRVLMVQIDLRDGV
ncbi:MAG TPA: hypothetical protein ENJ18_07090, partial [Nannocystis exedens]|nr:hypothetical protein [Nannocystis exedens]